jgi:hypothetical protein
MSGRLSVDQFFEAGWVPVRSDRFDEAAVEVGVDAKNVIERRQRVLGFLAIGAGESLRSHIDLNQLLWRQIVAGLILADC